ncbi:MAG TPA: efflux RND transporter periplasmic adaptor subunit [Gemmatimonadaceae bacterium]|jgi:HlyD family secretion protein|nr:efflux RND transporter periplasmic adaptor subunit [Gemmatimonadaceae bacterium]
MSKRVKWSISAVILIAIVAVVATAAAKRSNAGVEVRIAPVTRANLVASVTASGQVSPHTKVNVSSDVSGKITRLAVKEGDLVTKGQFLLQIDPANAEATVKQWEANVASAKAQLAQSKANLIQAQQAYDRSLALQKANPQFVPQATLDQLKTTLDVNQAVLESASHQVDQANASLQNARSSLAKTTIYAPMSGQVTRLNVEQGETAIEGTFNKDAATLLTISDMSQLETKVRVDETDVARVQVGDSAVVQIDAFPDTTFLGRVTEIANSSVGGAAAAAATSGQAVDYEVTIRLLNPPKDTRPDFSATAKVITATRTNALAIPIIALTVRENQATPSADTAVGLGRPKPKVEVGKKDVEGVFVVGADNKVTFRPVKVGIAGEQDFEVLGGLKEGERIVTGTYEAIRNLKDGTVVRQTGTDTTKLQDGSK